MTLLYHLFFQLSLLHASWALSSPSSKSPKSSPIIQVYDNILPKKTCHDLHKITSTLGLNHRVFSRNNNNNNNSPAAVQHYKYNPIENAISLILDEMNDTSPYVEYWSRQEWKNIEAHADVDEHRAKRQQQQQQMTTETKDDNGNNFRYPKNGHVLYLQVGTDVRGPTCLFPRRRSGGDLLRPPLLMRGRRQQQQQQQQQSKNNDEEGDKDNNVGGDNIEVVTVPAVPGRLLRFEGSTLHAVPRPSDLWFVSYVSGTGQTEPEDVWGRSVILFNTWDDPPLGVEGGDDDNKVSQAEGSNDESLSSSSSSSEAMEWGMSCHPRKEWDDIFSMDDDESRRTGDDEGCEAERGMPIDNDEDYNTKAKIWLLGDQRRRDYYGRNIKFRTTEKLKEAIHEQQLVSRTFLKQL